VLGEPVTLRSLHSPRLGLGGPEHLIGWPASAWYRIPGGIAAIRLLRPEPLVLLVRQGFEALNGASWPTEPVRTGRA
jgi:hypothetical protein